MKKLLLMLLTSVTMIACQPNQAEESQPSTIDSTKTDVIIKNSSELDSVQVFVTLQAQESIIGLFGMDSTNLNPGCKNTDGSLCTDKGVFWAKKGVEYHLGRYDVPVAGAVISFGGDNYGCEAAISHGFMYGLNIFEFTVNMGEGMNESTDLSCLDGLNSYLKLTVSDTVNWVAGGKNIVSAENTWPLEKNCGIPGVYPYHCDVCIDTLTPPHPVCFPWVNPKESCTNNPVNNCQFDRAVKAGGNVTCEFLGFTPVPAEK